MTRYIDVKDVCELMRVVGVNEILTGMAAYIEADYRRWTQFDKSARVASHSRDGVIELMPIADSELYGFKYVNGHPRNTSVEMLTVMAFGVLAQVDTGYPTLLSELTLTTAIRTAATSALFARYLARPDSRSMAIIGNGAQSEFQALAFHGLLGIDEVRIYDIDPRASHKLKRNLSSTPGLTVIIADSVASAVRGADIVTTVTADKTNATILTPEMIEPGMHINAVGGDCPGKTELHADILRAARVIVEYAPQTRIEGDIQQLPADFPVIEFQQILNGQEPGRQCREQVTVFDSVGFALEDLSALRYLLDQALIHDIGVPISLVPLPNDPKDLYGLALGTNRNRASMRPNASAHPLEQTVAQ